MNRKQSNSFSGSINLKTMVYLIICTMRQSRRKWQTVASQYSLHLLATNSTKNSLHSCRKSYIMRHCRIFKTARNSFSTTILTEFTGHLSSFGVWLLTCDASYSGKMKNLFRGVILLIKSTSYILVVPTCMDTWSGRDKIQSVVKLLLLRKALGSETII